jgi:hypothetical protein
MKIKRIAIDICEGCLNGEGKECHTPGCALFLHSVDLPINPDIYTVLHEFDSETGSEPTFETCEAVGHCPKPTADAAPFHHFYWDGERDEARMEEIHGANGKGHADPMSEYGAVECKTCGRKALVRNDAEDFPEI